VGDLWHRCSESDGSLDAKHALGLGKEGGRRGDAVDALVAEGCSVSRAAARRSAPSCKVRVDECSPIKASRVLPDVNVGRGASLECVLLDKCCCLPDAFEAGAERGITLATAEMLAGCPAAP
jgi:ADP-glucose pyrophosphorylase